MLASTAISHRKDPVSSAPGSETMSSPFSTWIGDGLGIAGAVGFTLLDIFFFFFFFFFGTLHCIIKKKYVCSYYIITRCSLFALKLGELHGKVKCKTCRASRDVDFVKVS